MNVFATKSTSPRKDARARGVLLRKCDCGSDLSGKSCSKCATRADTLQRKSAYAVGVDPLEDEADRIADSVISMPAQEQGARAPLRVRQSVDASAADVLAVPASVDRVLGEPGVPLPPPVRRHMEQRFDSDFSRVRVHTDGAAQQSAREVSARAYTVGQHIVFGQRQYTPETVGGKRLLAHELTHTLQQSGAEHNAGPLRMSRLQRQGEDSQSDEAGSGVGEIVSVIIDPRSHRTHFHAQGGKVFNGQVTRLASGLTDGDYLLKRATSKDPLRTWDIFNADGTPFRGGLEFEVTLEGVRFDALTYASSVQLKVANGLLPELVDIAARIKAIADEVSKSLVNDKEELAILKLLDDIPSEQTADFVRALRAAKVGEVPLLERLDKDIDGDNNIALHQRLSRLKLQAGGSKTAAALADAPTLAWHDVMGFFEQKAVFSVTASGNAKYRIRYLGGISSGLYSSPEYSEVKSMGRKDRLNIMTGGIEVDADQPIIVHDYDNDRKVVLTAEDLIAYQHAGVRKFLQDIGTIASLATPVGAETVSARVLAYGVQIATVATVIVDENKLNIRKWFPNWGPAIIDASEKIKIALAIVGVAQLVQGGWKLFANLRRLRAARAAMDAKAVASGIEELALAEKQAAQLEGNADKLLNEADLARKELGLVDESVQGIREAKGGAKPEVSSGGAIVAPPGAKTRIIEAAIAKGDFAGEFSALANRELSNAAENPSRLRPARHSGYSVEISIDGTDHTLARNAAGTWCLFSSAPKGCGAITVAKTVDDLFADIGREVGTTKAVRIGDRARVDIAAAVADAKQAGFVGAAGEPVAVDLVVQPHSAASEVRDAIGVSGKDVQSAHHAPTSAIRDQTGYSREGALTVLLPRATHRAFDDYWKSWSIAQVKSGKTTTTVEHFIAVVDQAIQQTPNIDIKTKGAMSWLLQNEFYRDLGLKPSDVIRLPYSK